ncbi:hypothetical protein E2C01_082978 [Portunus trituberculatus]|uniref:Uncharacterized protein n=1 Tax=Portunus trituberculatus TaxID=210409 RepID=A0A5B7J573_PORTR|nr:hypothetical protein [Portunus trituberculatus]
MQSSDRVPRPIFSKATLTLQTQDSRLALPRPSDLSRGGDFVEYWVSRCLLVITQGNLLNRNDSLV